MKNVERVLSFSLFQMMVMSFDLRCAFSRFAVLYDAAKGTKRGTNFAPGWKFTKRSHILSFFLESKSEKATKGADTIVRVEDIDLVACFENIQKAYKSPTVWDYHSESC